MLNTRMKSHLLSSLVVLTSLTSTSNAGGLIGDAINVIAPGVGTQLDKAHADAGRPLDYGAAYAANSVTGYPVGSVWLANDLARRQAEAAARSAQYGGYGAPHQQPYGGYRMQYQPYGRYVMPYQPYGYPYGHQW